MAGDTKKKTYVLEAQDSFSATFNEFRRQLGGIGNDVSALRGHIGGVAGAFDALGFSFKSLLGILSLGGFAALIKGAVESEAALYRASLTTGMTVESLSSMMPAAKAAGLGLDELAKLSQKLSKSENEALDPHSKAAKAMEAIGVTATDAAGRLKAPELMMLEVAKALDKYQDGAGKTALAQALMGKSGAEALPFLKELAERGELNAKVTTAQALEAKKFEDAMKTLSSQGGALGRTLANELLPAVNDIVKAFMDGRREAGLWEGAIAAVSVAWEKLLGTAAENNKARLGVVNDQLTAIYNWKQALNGAIVSESTQIETTRKENALLRERGELQRVIGDYEKAEAARRAAIKPPEPKKDLQFGGGGALTGESPMAASNALIAQLKKEELQLGLVNKEHLKYQEVQIQILKIKANGKPVNEDEINRLAKLIDLKTREIQLDAMLAADHQKDLDWRGQQADLLEKAIGSLEDQNDRLDFEAGLLGKTNTQREIAIALREKEILLAKNKDSAQALRDINEQYDLLISKLQNKEANENAFAFWNELADRGSRVFVDMATSGKNAFDVLKKALGDFAKEVLAFFAKKLILNVAASGTASGTVGSALASSAGSSGAGSLAGSVAGSALNWAGSATGATAAIYGSGGFMTGWTSAVAGVGGVEGLGVAGTIGSYLGTAYAAVMDILAAIPVWGWIVMAVVAIAAYFGGKGGGPKTGGSSMQMLNADGTLKDMAVPGADNGRFFTPNQGDSSLNTATSGIAQGYGALARQFGGTPGQFGFGLGFDNDPQGTDKSHTHAMVTDAVGRVIYDSIHSMDDKAVSGQLQIDAQRMVLRALQETNLPPAIAAIFKTVDAFSATTEQINGVLQLAGAFQTLSSALGDFSLDQILTNAHKDGAAQFKDTTDSFLAFAQATPMTTEGLNALTTATINYKNAAAQVILVLDQASTQIKDMFAATGRTIRTSTMSNSEKYDFLQAETAQLYGQIGRATTAEEITRITQQINADINEAWGLLTPDQQRSSQSDFLTRLDATNTKAQDRIHELQEKAADAAKQVLDRVQTIMEAAALALTQAAQHINDAADVIATGAARPVQVVLTDKRTGAVNG